MASNTSSPELIQLNPHTVAHALDGEVDSHGTLAPGPGQAKDKRSLRVFLDPAAPGGFRTHSFRGDDPILCRDHVRERLGMPPWEPGEQPPPSGAASAPRPAGPTEHQVKMRGEAQWIWSEARPVASGSPVLRYINDRRGFPLTADQIPPTIRHLAPSAAEPDLYLPNVVSAFCIPDEPEPGQLATPEKANIVVVHRIFLAPDGTKKASEAGLRHKFMKSSETQKDKMVFGSPDGMPIVISPVNDAGVMFVTEGVEDGLAVLSAHLHVGDQVGIWAAGAAPFFSKLAKTVPTYVEVCTVMAHDDGGLDAAEKLSAALIARGIESTFHLVGEVL